MKLALEQYTRFLKLALTILLGLMIVPVSLQILSRHTGIVPRYVWTEEIARFCFVWIIMIGSMVAVREGSHFNVDFLPTPKTNRGVAFSRFATHVAMLAMAFVFAWYGYDFARFGFRQNSEMSGINMLSIYASFPIAGISWILFLCEKLGEDYALFKTPDESDRE